MSVFKMYWIEFSLTKIANIKLITDDGWQPNSDESEEEEESELVGKKWQQHCHASSRREFSEFCHQFFFLLLAPKLLGPGEVTHSE